LTDVTNRDRRSCVYLANPGKEMPKMPAKSKAQQRSAGIALAVKEHEKPKSSLKGASKSMYSSMSEKELKKMASTSRKGKPEHAGKSK